MRMVFEFSVEEVSKIVEAHLRELHNIPEEIFEVDTALDDDGNFEIKFSAAMGDEDEDEDEEEGDEGEASDERFCKDCKYVGVSIEDEPCKSCEEGGSNFVSAEDEPSKEEEKGECACPRCKDEDSDEDKCPRCESTKQVVQSCYLCEDHREKGPLPILLLWKCKDCPKLVNSKTVRCKRCGYSVTTEKPAHKQK